LAKRTKETEQGLALVFIFQRTLSKIMATKYGHKITRIEVVQPLRSLYHLHKMQAKV
jgi:hypothetical protein